MAQGMREVMVRAATFEALSVAQEAAIAAIGKRGGEASRIMRVVAQQTRTRLRDERWAAILRGAQRSAFARRRADEGTPWRQVSGQKSQD